MAEEHGCDRRSGGSVGADRVLAEVQAALSAGSGEVSREGQTGLAILDERYCQVWQGRRVSEADPLRPRIPARRRTGLGCVRNVPGDGRGAISPEAQGMV